MKRKEDTVVLSFRRPKSFVDRFDSYAKSLNMDRVDFLEVLVDDFVKHSNNTTEPAMIHSVDEPPKHFLECAINKHFPQLVPDVKYNEAFNSMNERELEEAVKLAKRRKRRGLNYDTRLEQYL